MRAIVPELPFMYGMVAVLVGPAPWVMIMVVVKLLGLLKLLSFALLVHTEVYYKLAKTINNYRSIEGFNFIQSSLTLNVGLEAFITFRRHSTHVSICQVKSMYNLLLLSGDISSNPGPNRKFPCGVCEKPVKRNQRGVCCDQCNTWIHTRCCSMSSGTYEELANTSCIWICPTCELLSFSGSILHSDVDLNTRNSFSPLEEENSLPLNFDVSASPLQSMPRQRCSSSSKKPAK